MAGSTSNAVTRLHATTIAADGAAVALLGASGSGKSTLALQCISTACEPFIHGAVSLVSDDITEIRIESGTLAASPPPQLAGLIEMSGLGIVRIPHVPTAKLFCAVELTAQSVPRLPELDTTVDIAGQQLPLLKIERSDPAAAIKTLSWLSICTGRLSVIATDTRLETHDGGDG